MTHPKPSAFFIFSFIIFLIGMIVYGIYIGLKIVRATNTVFASGSNAKTISITGTIGDLARKADESTLHGFESGRINILLLGIAGEGTEKKGELLTDTIMIASIDTQSHRVALLSLPRDLLVETDRGLNKINAFYGIGATEKTGTDEIVNAAQIVTGLEIDYHLVMDFAGFTKIVDALGGINIDVPRTIDDPLYPGPGYSYDPFYLEKGFHQMDGALALKYVRTRHDDPESDFGRAKRQQTVMRAIRNKALSVGTIANPFKLTELLEVLSDHIVTNVTTSEIRAFGELASKVDTQNVTTVVVDAWKEKSLLISTQIKTPFGAVAGLSPRGGDWDEIRDYAANIFSLEKITLRRDAIVAENPQVLLLNASGERIVASRVASLLSGLGFENIDTAQAQSREIITTSSVIDSTDGAIPFSIDEILRQIDVAQRENVHAQFQKYIPTVKLDEEPKEDDNEAESQSTSDKIENGAPSVRQSIQDDARPSVRQSTSATATDIIIVLGSDLLDTYTYEDAHRDVVEKEYKPLPPKKDQ